MGLTYQLYAHDPHNLSATYFGDELKRPFQYKIKLVSKKAKSFGDTLDYIITEMNTEVEHRVSQGQLIDAMATAGNDSNEVAKILFGDQFDRFLKKQNYSKYDDFIIANKEYFAYQMKMFNAEPEHLYTILAINVHVFTAELLIGVYSELVRQHSQKK
ncbi:hypothetical protein L2D08_06940 [Domibacillus sp. PGB-M46]|uniref:hypothetical protein n=1 Tax=Domibacillus sp. PGB-M46 TaxID=2910255 RepID=UPI001F58443A|nr:hypothetical protein [Domibacillus sp. PGB-M46]MCI2254097.1 hypothetical protein [Domibacillus sp. PGB-M46]